jgi:hypothetical protein
MRGSVGESELAIKFAQAYDREVLAGEASIYEWLGRSPGRPSIPVFYGLFKSTIWHALVLSFEGAEVESFMALPLSSR